MAGTVLLRFVHWFLKALASGRFPGVRDDGSEFLESDKGRAGLAGMSLAFAACVQLRGDWPEFCETMC